MRLCSYGVNQGLFYSTYFRTPSWNRTNYFQYICIETSMYSSMSPYLTSHVCLYYKLQLPLSVLWISQLFFINISETLRWGWRNIPQESLSRPGSSNDLLKNKNSIGFPTAIVDHQWNPNLIISRCKNGVPSEMSKLRYSIVLPLLFSERQRIRKTFTQVVLSFQLSRCRAPLVTVLSRQENEAIWPTSLKSKVWSRMKASQLFTFSYTNTYTSGISRRVSLWRIRTFHIRLILYRLCNVNFYELLFGKKQSIHMQAFGHLRLSQAEISNFQGAYVFITFVISAPNTIFLTNIGLVHHHSPSSP